MNTTELKFTSGEARTDMFAGVGGLVYTAIFAWLHPDMWEGALVFAGLISYLIWRAARAWQRPYVQLTAERLVVFEHGRPKHYVELAAVAAVRQGFNRTVLLMHDGMKISISHLSFLHTDDARDFRQALDERLPKPVA